MKSRFVTCLLLGFSWLLQATVTPTAAAGPNFVFILVDDIGETRNLYASNIELAQRLEKEYHRWMEQASGNDE